MGLNSITTLAHGSWNKYEALFSILKKRALEEHVHPSLIRTSTGVDSRCLVCNADFLGSPTHALLECPHTLTSWLKMVAAVSAYLAGIGRPGVFYGAVDPSWQSSQGGCLYDLIQGFKWKVSDSGPVAKNDK